jgi:cyclic pyranopterin phosphate synthase
MKENKIEAIIDVGGKPSIRRIAVATGIILLQEKTILAIKNNEISKGNVIEASTVAVIQAVKDTPRIIPHCHIVPIEGCNVDWGFEGRNLRCTVEVSANYRTGVEMEALVGVSAGLLCVFDMVKSFEKDDSGQYPEATINDIKVLSKKKLI